MVVSIPGVGEVLTEPLAGEAALTQVDEKPSASGKRIVQYAEKSGFAYEAERATVADRIGNFTAKLLGDPIALTIEVIDRAGFYTHAGAVRWLYMAMPSWLWQQQTRATKIRIIGEMYSHEGGTELRHLFPSV